MNTDISNLEPKIVWGYFSEITKIPRASKKEDKIVSYVCDFATKHHLTFVKDSIGNIIIYKQATKGMEDSPVTILQSHLDMVCEKNSDKEFNFDTDPIEAYFDNGWVRANGTTLGADCGVGVAITLAILASDDISHPAIEALFTIDEEEGMTGAKYIDKGILKGKYLINLDSEDEGEVFIGCAGGVDTVGTFKLNWVEPAKNSVAVRLDIKGLQGGHSGDDINKGFINANRALARFLFDNRESYCFDLALLEGGNLRNAIAREASAIISLATDKVDSLKQDFDNYYDLLKSEYETNEPNISFEFSTLKNGVDKVIERDQAYSIISCITVVPDGVTAMSQNIPNFVETSTNLASVKMSDNELVIATSQRSSIESKREFLKRILNELFVKYGASVEHSEGYPGWQPSVESPLVDAFANSYSNLFNRSIRVKAVHAGLECGLILEKYPNLDMVSVGPTIRRVHSPDECIDVETVDMFWDLLLETLKGL